MVRRTTKHGSLKLLETPGESIAKSPPFLSMLSSNPPKPQTHENRDIHTMHQIQVHIRKPQALQAQVQIFRHLPVERAPELRRDEDLLASADAGPEGPSQAGADFGFVLVAVRAVNVAVARLEGVVDRVRDGAGGGLPCSCGGGLACGRRI